MMILIPNILTALNLLTGLASIHLASCGQGYLAVWLLFVSALWDGLDGRLARFLKKESFFGEIFDSIADFVAFGLAPAFIALWSDKPTLSFWIALASGTYVFCAIFRLIRFHMTRRTQRKKFFEGLPTTASAVCFATVSILIRDSSAQQIVYPVLLLTLSTFMVSRIHIQRLSLAHFKNRHPEAKPKDLALDSSLRSE